jgi:predicted 3-demethylubiquinone-9 3-methyltransferase (glyoxalase superfamily)
MTKKPKAARKPNKPGSSIAPFLTFKENGEDAVKLYVSTFKNSRVIDLMRHPSAKPGERGALMYAAFELDGREFYAMDAGPSFSFEQGFSIMWTCKTQADIDRVTAKLSTGGEVQPCGWLKDRFGLSWQIVPEALGEMMMHPEKGNASAMIQAMLGMHKLDLAALRKAYRQ